MKELEGMREAFRRTKIVFLTTFSGGEEHSRPMTNLNDDPYSMMWFPTYRDTTKVEDIRMNPRVLVTFPGSREGEFYEIAGRAEFEEERKASDKWQWWYLYWHPEQTDRFWFPRVKTYPERVIINVYPLEARVVKKGAK